MLWLFLLCLALAVIIAVLALKIHLMQISAEEIMHQLDERLDTDTNTLISLSSRVSAGGCKAATSSCARRLPTSPTTCARH